MASHVDPLIAQAFERASDIFNHTAVIWVSDHGLHFGRHLETLEGQVEHKLPMLRIMLPQWWLRRHPTVARNLERNRGTLLHHYDLHATIEHLMRVDEDYYLKKRSSVCFFIAFTVVFCRSCLAV